MGNIKDRLMRFSDNKGPLMIAKSVKQYIQAGVASFHIEDQVLSKRCGHLAGKKVVSKEEYLMRLCAAKYTINRLQSDIVLVARTDALQQHGYEECIDRIKAAPDLGADVGLLEGFISKEQARKAVRDLAPGPAAQHGENGSTPIITTKEAEEMGFRIMIFPLPRWRRLIMASNLHWRGSRLRAC